MRCAGGPNPLRPKLLSCPWCDATLLRSVLSHTQPRLMPRLPDLRPAAIAHLLLPLGTLLQLGLSPVDLAVSGLRQTSLLPSLRAAASRSVCAFERPNVAAGLPLCRSSCWRSIHVCTPRYQDVRDSFGAWNALEDRREATEAAAAAVEAAAATGLAAAIRDERRPILTAPLASVPPALAPLEGHSDLPHTRVGRPRPATPLRILFAARAGRRRVANLGDVLADCNRATPAAIDAALPPALRPATASSNLSVACSMLPPDASHATKRRRVRASDVFVAMWGGDTLHALNLPRGSAVVEMRHSTFARGAPWSWISMARLWIMRDAFAKQRPRPLSFYSLHLPESATVPSPELTMCLGNASAQTAKYPQTDERWRCYWNVDVRVDFWRHLLPTLTQIASDRRRGVINLGAEDVCRKRYCAPAFMRFVTRASPISLSLACLLPHQSTAQTLNVLFCPFFVLAHARRGGQDGERRHRDAAAVRVPYLSCVAKET